LPLPTEDDVFDEDYDEEKRSPPVLNPMRPMSIETGRRMETRRFAFPTRRRCGFWTKVCACLLVFAIGAAATGLALPMTLIKKVSTYFHPEESTLPAYESYSALSAFDVVGGDVVGGDDDDDLQPILGAVTKRGIVLEATWEKGRLENPNVIHEAAEKNLYRLFYGACSDDACERRALAYAESADGLKWTKPELNLTKNNVVAWARGVGVTYAADQKRYWALGELCVERLDDSIKDYDADAVREAKSDACPSSKVRRNAVALNVPFDDEEATYYYSQAETIDWDALVPNFKWETHNNLVYDPARQLWIATTRIEDAKHGRQIAVATSKRLKQFWEELPRVLSSSSHPEEEPLVPVTVLRGKNKKRQYDAMVTFPWHDVLLGIVMESRPVTTDSKGENQVGDDTVRTKLAWTTKPRPTEKDEESKWRLLDGELIPLGKEEGDFDSHTIHAATPALALESSTDTKTGTAAGAETSRLYYVGGRKGEQDDGAQSAVGLATIDPQRYVGVATPTTERDIRSTWVRCSGKSLKLTFDTTEDGSCLSLLKVESRQDRVAGEWTFCDSEGKQHTDLVVPNLDLRKFVDQDVRLSFRMQPGTTFFSFGFFL